jgi:urea carboxylase
LAAANAVPLAPGSGLVGSLEDAQAEAARIGYPVMLKSTAGGGGIGMQVCHRAEELAGAYETVARLSQANFKDGGMFLEKFVARARHIEVQIFGDGKGEVIALGERDCSLQRRNQKVVEETPAPDLPEEIRQALFGAAERLGRAVQYANAGTVEFLYDADTREFYFLEVNTRLQVEHGVTEQVTGVDLVEWMVRQAAGELELQRPAVCGASIQVRVYAEDPGQNFRPSSGQLTAASFPAGARVETWVERGSEITPFYDPMIAKVIVTGANRGEAIGKLREALEETQVAGIATNVEYLRQVVASEVFRGASMTTAYLNAFQYVSHAVDVLDGGTQTTVQDYPGRLGYWEVGVPPSGPMDALAFRLANRLVGNGEGAAGLECTVTGPTLQFRCDAVIALTGADMEAKLDGKRVPRWEAMAVRAGQTLRMNQVVGAGIRAYVAVRGGFDVPEYLGSRATFALGKFGGHGGRVLRAGDVLPVRELTAGAAERTEHDGWRHRPVLLHRLEGALQLRSNRGAADWAEAGVGAEGRGRGGPASFERARQRLCRGHGGLHGRHADYPGAGRAEPGGICLSGDDCVGGAVEDGAVEGRRHRAVPADDESAGGAAGVGAGPGHCGADAAARAVCRGGRGAGHCDGARGYALPDGRG